MIFLLGGGRRGPRGLRRCWGGSFLDVAAQDLLDGARLAGDCGELKKQRFGDEAAEQQEDGDGVFLCRALQDNGVEMVDAAHYFREAAAQGIDFFEALVERRGALEIEAL